VIDLLDFAAGTLGATAIIWISAQLLSQSAPKSAGRPKHTLTVGKMNTYYDHTRPIKDVIKFMESHDLQELFLCGRMFRVVSIQNVSQKIRLFEVKGTHTPQAELIHVDDFDTRESWALKALYTALKDDVNAKEVIAQLVVLRMKL